MSFSLLLYVSLYIEPVNPTSPNHLMIKDITTDSAIIQWTVSYISYSPETYVVKYGTSQDTLIHNSDSTYSGDDITITDMTYSVKLSNLKGNTTYYVQVVATNTALRSNMSSVEQFMTLPYMEMRPGMYILTIIMLLSLLSHKVDCVIRGSVRRFSV